MAEKEGIKKMDVAREAQVFLQPIAAPSILGLFALAGSTFMVGAWMAGWYGSATTPSLLAPFIGIFGGLAQFFAAMWAFKARDGLASAIHGTWGSFFIGYGLLSVMLLAQPQLQPAGIFFPELGIYYVVIAAVTWFCTLAAMSQSKVLTLVLTLLSAAATAGAVAFFSGAVWVERLSGYLMVIGSFCACYDATAQVLKEVYGHEILKIGLSRRMAEGPPIMVGTGEPGVIHGQR
jgi:succinate-acetate transporter protein